jgi:hypothetical protein
MKDKCCGNCRYFTNEDLDGFGFCDKIDSETHCALHYDCHEGLNGWTEITPDNVDELYESKERVCVAFVCNGEVSYMCGQFGITLSTMAKYGGYYYFVLPELKIE